MIRPVTSAASWVGGRLLLLLVIVAALVALDAYRDESSLLQAQIRSLLPDADLVTRLEAGRDVLRTQARSRSDEINARLRTAHSASVFDIDDRLRVIDLEIRDLEAKRRSGTQKMLALLTGRGFEQDLAIEIDVQLLVAERDALGRFRKQVGARRASLSTVAAEFEASRQRTVASYAAYLAAQGQLEIWQADHIPLVWLPGSTAWRHANELRRERDRHASAYRQAGTDFYAARARLRDTRALGRLDIGRVESASASILGPLDDLIATKRDALESMREQADRVQRSVRRVFVDAFLILLAVTLAPVAIKAFWYWIVAPIAERRPAIRLRPRSGFDGASGSKVALAPAPGEKISAVSHALSIGEQEELLVQPDFLQSSSDSGRKDTKWLLDWRYPLTSVASGMVALTRIRASTNESFVVSSKTDALAEVGVIPLADGEALVLQPRSLVGIVQPVARPLRIRRRWIFGLSAWITFQFRYLVFEGPGTLIVQGCRGIRLEPAGTGRSIDQSATIGFSANLDYSPRRSETFGAYLMGMRGLFNDGFSGAPGYCVYEEMPYLGRRSGITGRGLEGLTDGLLKIFGI